GLFPGRLGPVLRGHQRRRLVRVAVLPADRRRADGSAGRRHPVLPVDRAGHPRLRGAAVRRIRPAPPPPAGARHPDGLSPAWATGCRRSTPAPATTAAPGWATAAGWPRIPRGSPPTGPTTRRTRR